ncbi:hypothetical protein FQZ97_927680 [compost metagenome]
MAHVDHTPLELPHALHQQRSQRKLASQRAQPGLKAMQPLAHALLVVGFEELGRGKTLGQRRGKRQRTIHLGAVERQTLVTPVRMADDHRIPPQHLDRLPADHPGIGQMRVATAPLGPAGLGLTGPGQQAQLIRLGKPEQTQTQYRLLHTHSSGLRPIQRTVPTTTVGISGRHSGGIGLCYRL